MAAAASIDFKYAVTDVDWGEAEGLIQELIDWDAAQCERLGFERAQVIHTFYPDALDDIRRHSAAPDGCFLLATGAGGTAGCASYRRLSATTCELYNVYVRTNYRGRSIGARMVKQLQSIAIAAGYETMYLETACFMTQAHRVYRSLQFQVIESYRSIPDRFVPFTISMQCALRPGAT